jgi:stage V sporulation protein K
MRQFVASNSGLKNRFSHYLHFLDYNPDELTGIFSAFAEDVRVQLGDGVTDRARGPFMHGSKSESFGNARFARTLFEEAFANMAARAFQDDRIDEGELELMIVADLPAPGTHRTIEMRRVGFRPTTN